MQIARFLCRKTIQTVVKIASSLSLVAETLSSNLSQSTVGFKLDQGIDGHPHHRYMETPGGLSDPHTLLSKFQNPEEGERNNSPLHFCNNQDLH
jgi:hypothetical protein